MKRQNSQLPQQENRKELDDRRSITWREFLLICSIIYRQVLPGTLLLAGAMLLLIILLRYMAG